MHLVVAAGPTREWIDPVRFLTNASSGRMGWELARAGLVRFRSVSLIHGPVDEQFANLAGAARKSVETTEEMADAVHGAIGDDCLLIMAAAPADFRPVQSADQKIKKDDRGELVIHCRATVDILKSLIPRAGSFRNLVRVGFAAETDDLEAYALRKLREKDLDFICANRVYRDRQGFGDRENTILLIDRDAKSTSIGPLAKDRLADAILDRIAALLPANSGLTHR